MTDQTQTAAESDAARLALVVTHTRTSTPCGPDYCAECSEAITEWVPWPCARVIASAETCPAPCLLCPAPCPRDPSATQA